MNEEQLRKLAAYSVIFMMIVAMCGIYVNHYYSIEAADTINVDAGMNLKNLSKCMQQIVTAALKEIQQNAATNTIQLERTEEIEKKLGKHYIKIKRTDQEIKDITLVDMYEQQKIAVLFRDKQSEEHTMDIKTTDISLVREGREYSYDAKNEKYPEIVKDIKIFTGLEKDENSKVIYNKMLEIANSGRRIEAAKVCCRVEIQLNEVYAYDLYADQEYIYINVQPLREVYDSIIVIDAGHGGKDTGTGAITGKETEKDINLAIVKRLSKYLEQEEKIKVYYTRLTDKGVSLEGRVSLANTLGADLFLSVHCNSSDEAPVASGIEVLYKNEGEEKEASKKFAKIILNHLIENTGRKKRRILKGNHIYIIRNANMPVALAELGFLDDASDLFFVKSEEGQDALAKGMYEGILEMLSKMGSVE